MAKHSHNKRPVRRTTRSAYSSRRTNTGRRRSQPVYEFKPDTLGSSWIKRLYLTRQQRQTFLKWFLLALVCTAVLVIQDVIFSRFQFLGATTDLTPAVIILVSVMVGLENGSVFVLIASALYWFSGSAPGAYCIALLCVFTIAVLLFRQTYWRSGFGATVVCTGAALMLYEMSVFLAGILLNLTQWGRFYRFVLAGAMSFILILPLYPLCLRIDQIGGNPWKD